MFLSNADLRNRVTFVTALFLALAFPDSTIAVPSETDLANLYTRTVAERVGPIWRDLQMANEKKTRPGTVQTQFEVMPNGSITNIRIVSNSADRLSVEIARRALRIAKIPPIPRDLLRTLPKGLFDSHLDFTLYPK